jgi:NADH:ubiquinone oxidoreductase subunit B-like Fe-S oxidoreductase
VAGLQPFNLNTSVCDWHFSEFSSCMNFALYCCCVELMALPLPGKDVARQLIEAIYAKYVCKIYDVMMISLYYCVELEIHLNVKRMRYWNGSMHWVSCWCHYR